MVEIFKNLAVEFVLFAIVVSAGYRIGKKQGRAQGHTELLRALDDYAADAEVREQFVADQRRKAHLQ